MAHHLLRQEGNTPSIDFSLQVPFLASDPVMGFLLLRDFSSYSPLLACAAAAALPLCPDSSRCPRVAVSVTAGKWQSHDEKRGSLPRVGPFGGSQPSLEGWELLLCPVSSRTARPGSSAHEVTTPPGILRCRSVSSRGVRDQDLSCCVPTA